MEFDDLPVSVSLFIYLTKFGRFLAIIHSDLSSVASPVVSSSGILITHVLAA